MLVSPAPLGRQDFQSADLRESCRYLRASYGVGFRLVTDPGQPVQVRHQRLDAGGYRIDEVAVSRAWFEFPPLDAVVIAQLRSGRIHRTGLRGGQSYAPGDVFVLADPGSGYSGQWWDVRARCVLLSPRLVDLAAGDGVRRERHVRFPDYSPLPAAAALQWLRVLDFVAADLLSGSGGVPSEVLVETSGQLLAATALGQFPNTASGATLAARPEMMSETTRRAMAFIEAHPERDLGVTDIAQAAFVTPRAVQLAFRKELGTTPMSYLRRVRLQLARAELRAARASGSATVTEVAARWGFTNPSRFASYYRDEFGELPSQTLRR